MRTSTSRAALALLLCLAACGQSREGHVSQRGDGALEKGVHDILPLPPNAPERAELEGRSTPGPLVATLQGAGASSGLKGKVHFIPTATGVELQSSIQALPAGPHALRVHTYGDCSDVAGGSAGPALDLASLGGEFAPHSDPKDRGASQMDRQRPPGRTIYPTEPRVQADGAPPTPNNLGPSNASPGFGPASEVPSDPASSGTSRTAGSPASGPAASQGTQTPTGGVTTGSEIRTGQGEPQVGEGQGTLAGSGPGSRTTQPVGAPTPGQTTSSAAGSTGAPPAGSESAQAVQGGSDLGEIVGVAEGSAEARQVLAQLTPASLSHLVGRALVIYPAGNQGGAPLACGVIGVSSQTNTANNQNSVSPNTPGSGTEGLAP